MKAGRVFFFFAPLKLVPLCQSRAIHPRRIEGYIFLRSNSNQVCLDGSSRQILTWQIQELLRGSASSPAQRGENREPATLGWAESPRAKRDDLRSLSGNMRLRRRRCAYCCETSVDWTPPKEVRITKEGSVNKEAFQGETLNITCVGKCADPERA